MKVGQTNLFAATSIVDRKGRRVAHYLVDKAKDSLDKEEQKRPRKSEEAVVFQVSDENEEHSREKADSETEGKEPAPSLLNITA
jgi:hypothetical protein